MARQGRGPSDRRLRVASLPDAGRAVAEAIRAEGGRVVATLTRLLGDLEAAQDALQEAALAALERWPADGVPRNPAAWLTTAARNKALDRIRREGRRGGKEVRAMQLLEGADEPPEESVVRDDLLRLIFTCCHPALAPEARVALSLRTLGGLTTAEIARAFLVPEATMAQRLVRATPEDRRRRHPVPGAGGPRAARPAPRRPGGRLPRVHRGPHGDLGRARSCGSTCATRPCDSPGSWRSSCPTSPRCTGCSDCSW